ncbi:leucine-rich repeat protein [Sodaliphilus sp.]|uniref:leucine-rich repeat protein n=1 Tax=Sodaliphilus sp. TaxID=2815818 RepID=UPI00388DA9B1
MKKITLLLLALIAMNAGAVQYISGKLVFDLNSTNHTATVLAFRTDLTAADKANVNIPLYVTYNNEQYNVVSIHDYAFVNETDVKKITITKNVQHIAPATFVNGASSLEAINVDASNTAYSSVDGILYNKNQTMLYRCPEAFSGANADGTIAYNYLPKTVKTIGQNAFYQCAKLSSIRIRYGVESVGQGAFFGSAVKTLLIPSSVTSVGAGAFKECRNLSFFYFNLATPPAISDDMFELSSRMMTIYVPAESVDAYKAANVWKDYSNAIKQGAYDFEAYYGFAVYGGWTAPKAEYKSEFTIISNKPETINGKEYAGRVRVTNVSSYSNNNFTRNDSVCFNMGDDVNEYVGGPLYAVTSIGSRAFEANNFNFKLYLGANVDTIRPNAFKGTSHMDKLVFNRGLKYIGESAFDGCHIPHDIILPYGIERMEGACFAGNDMQRILVPSSIKSLGGAFIDRCSSLKEIYLNRKSFATTDNQWQFNNVPADCKLYVPAGAEDAYKANDKWKKFDISAGAFDFARGNDWFSSLYRVTITGETETLYTDVPNCAGYGKYVYHPNHAQVSDTEFIGAKYETLGDKSYIIGEIGEKCLVNCKQIKKIDLQNMKYLLTIKPFAFAGTGITEMEVPKTVSTIGEGTWNYCENLSELCILRSFPSIGGQFFRDNADDFTCYVKWTNVAHFQSEAMTWTSSSLPLPINRINAWVEYGDNYGDVQAISVNHPVDWKASALDAWVVTDYDANAHKAMLNKTEYTSDNQGVILTDIEKNHRYLLKRPQVPFTEKKNLLVGAATQSVDVYEQNVGYYFDNKEICFRRPTSHLFTDNCAPYLKLTSEQAGNTDKITIVFGDVALKGDVNGDGVVDITDANILINVTLGKDSASKYAGADVTGDGVVDIADVNAVLNIILGK